ncbi:hypothetical protein GU243_17080 [Pseudarthrobacter psychrotolerans]|uniref:Uncharacterized protein n=1 Tax=Pseudarthrobacter psychrotolerans TaxID=2697569 RepID=A0A6P1NW70_9MICC|nr:hypothetical protein [Pseudarthrobacter psychrotolerans]QHK21141.1 hypothetical protein GU243_17080 [Pseudarthrobacter psychrotolerans]
MSAFESVADRAVEREGHIINGVRPRWCFNDDLRLELAFPLPRHVPLASGPKCFGTEVAGPVDPPVSRFTLTVS